MSFSFDPEKLQSMLNSDALQNLAQQMQSKVMEAQEEIAAAKFEGTAGGGAVKITMNGAREVLSVTIAPEAVDPNGVDLLQDMIVAAFNNAQEKLNQFAMEKLGPMANNLGLPGM